MTPVQRGPACPFEGCRGWTVLFRSGQKIIGTCRDLGEPRITLRSQMRPPPSSGPNLGLSQHLCRVASRAWSVKGADSHVGCARASQSAETTGTAVSTPLNALMPESRDYTIGPHTQY